MGLFGKKNTRIDAKSFAIKVDEVFQSVGKNIFDASDIQAMLKQSALFRSKLTGLFMAGLEKKDYTTEEVKSFADGYLAKNGIALDEDFIKNHYQEAVDALKDAGELTVADISAAAKITMKDVKMGDDMFKKTVDKVLKNLG